MGLWYTTRESVKSALSTATTARDNQRVDRAIEAASRSIEGLLRRKFYPQTATRYFDWPPRDRSRPWRLWLDENELISVTTLTAGGVTITAPDYFLEPANSGPPYTRIEIDLASSAAFSSGATHQRAVAVTGVFGYSNDEETAGSLSADLAASLSATATINWSTARFGVGDILRIDSERMVVTERSMVDSTQNLQVSLTAVASNTTVAVTTGTAFAVDEVIQLDSERMLVVDVTGNNLTVKRAWDGSTLAAHTAPTADIYTLTGVELSRAQCGTTLAAHTSGATISRYVVPALIRDLCVAEALNTIQQEQSGYARTVGDGESERQVGGQGLTSLRFNARDRYGRRVRTGAV